MWNKKTINFIDPDIQWMCWYIEYKRIVWIFLTMIVMCLVLSSVYCGKQYIVYHDMLQEYETVQSHHIDATEAHQVYDAYRKGDNEYTQGTMKELIHILDAANVHHIQLVEWSTMDQWYLEARGANKDDLHQFSASLSRLGGPLHYDEMVEKEPTSSMYRIKITGTMERDTNTKKSSTHNT